MVLFFWICFGVGVGYTAIAFLLGEVVSIVDLDAGFDFGGAVSPLKPSVIAAFVTVFGGAGLLFTRFTALPLWMTLPVTAALGAAVALSMYRFIIVPLSRAQNTSAVEIQSLVGARAKVTEKIFQGGYGQITDRVNGNIYSAPAKAYDGGEIKRHSAVEIMSIQDGTYYVRVLV